MRYLTTLDQARLCAVLSTAEATRILELVRYANVHNQKPLVDDELKFIAKHPDIAQKIFTMNP